MQGPSRLFAASFLNDTFAVAGQTCIKLGKLSELRQLALEMSPDVPLDLHTQSFDIKGSPSRFLEFSSDESKLVVCNDELIRVYSADSLNSTLPEPVCIYKLDVPLRDIHRQPAHKNRYAFVDESNNLYLLDVSTNKGLLKHVATHIYSFSWCLEDGSRIIAGKTNGNLEIYTSIGHLESKVSGCKSDSPYVLSVSWPSTDTAFVVLATTSDDGDITQELLILDIDSTKHSWRQLEDNIFPISDAVNGMWYTQDLINDNIKSCPWLQIYMASYSGDIGLLVKSGGQLQQIEFSEDSDRATLPMSNTMDDTTPIGFVLDIFSDIRVKRPIADVESCPPLPIVWVLNSEGNICGWTLIDRDAVQTEPIDLTIAQKAYKEECQNSKSVEPCDFVSKPLEDVQITNEAEPEKESKPELELSEPEPEPQPEIEELEEPGLEEELSEPEPEEESKLEEELPEAAPEKKEESEPELEEGFSEPEPEGELSQPENKEEFSEPELLENEESAAEEAVGEVSATSQTSANDESKVEPAEPKKEPKSDEPLSQGKSDIEPLSESNDKADSNENAQSEIPPATSKSADNESGDIGESIDQEPQEERPTTPATPEPQIVDEIAREEADKEAREGSKIFSNLASRENLANLEASAAADLEAENELESELEFIEPEDEFPQAAVIHELKEENYLVSLDNVRSSQPEESSAWFAQDRFEKGMYEPVALNDEDVPRMLESSDEETPEEPSSDDEFELELPDTTPSPSILDYIMFDPARYEVEKFDEMYVNTMRQIKALEANIKQTQQVLDWNYDEGVPQEEAENYTQQPDLWHLADAYKLDEITSKNINSASELIDQFNIELQNLAKLKAVEMAKTEKLVARVEEGWECRKAESSEIVQLHRRLAPAALKTQLKLRTLVSKIEDHLSELDPAINYLRAKLSEYDQLQESNMFNGLRKGITRITTKAADEQIRIKNLGEQLEKQLQLHGEQITEPSEDVDKHSLVLNDMKAMIFHNQIQTRKRVCALIRQRPENSVLF